MNKLFGFLGRGAGIDLPYTIGEAYSTAWGSWTHSRGTKKVSEERMMYLEIEGASAATRELLCEMHQHLRKLPETH